MEPTKKNLLALEKIVYAYEVAIESLEAGKDVHKAWEDYGDCSICRLCISVGEPAYDCRKCILGPDREACASGMMRRSFEELRSKLEEWTDQKKLLTAFKTRLKAILKRVDQRGYEVK